MIIDLEYYSEMFHEYRLYCRYQDQYIVCYTIYQEQGIKVVQDYKSKEDYYTLLEISRRLQKIYAD